MNVSLVLTVLNEERTIRELLASISRQTQRPDEVVIIDAGSTDGTVAAIEDFKKNDPSLAIVTKVVPGNRSVGRNAAIQLARNEIVAVTDAGCVLDPDWLQRITEPFRRTPPARVVGGWYRPNVRTPWEHALATTLNFNVRNVRPGSFLPSSRSIAFTKESWSAAGGYPEQVADTSEDTLFDLAIRSHHIPIEFAPTAVVSWTLDQTVRRFYDRIRRYSFSDGQYRLMLAQYRIVAAFWMIVLAFIAAGAVLHPAAYIGAAFAVVGYLYLPLLQSKKTPSFSDSIYVPYIKGAMVLATTLGFIKGLCTRKP